MESIIRWFDHTDHTRYDLCADDHCQRYQGLTLAIGENVRTAIDQTWGKILTYDGKPICASFSLSAALSYVTAASTWPGVS